MRVDITARAGETVPELFVNDQLPTLRIYQKHYTPADNAATMFLSVAPGANAYLGLHGEEI